MKILILALLFLIPIKICALTNDTLIKSDLNQTNGNSNIEKLLIPDSLRVFNISEDDETNDLSTNMPWIAALIIGFLSFILNIIITNRTNKTASVNLSQQIQSAKDLALTDFKAKLKTENMQNWLDNLREDLSEYLSYCAITRAKLAESENYNSNKSTFENISDEFTKMVKFKVKLLTRLNLEHDEQRVVAEKINELFKRGFTSVKEFTAIEHITLENELLADMRKLVAIHWSKIKNIEK